MSRKRTSKNTQTSKPNGGGGIPKSLEQELRKVFGVALASAQATTAAVEVLDKIVNLLGTDDHTAAAKKVVAQSKTDAPSNGHEVKRGRPSPDGGALYRQVEALLRARPMLFRDLMDATGEENPNRIKGAITAFQREGKRVVNLGTKGRAKWFIQS